MESIISSTTDPRNRGDQPQWILPYIAALELEVDRLRRHSRLIRQEALALARATEAQEGEAGQAAQRLLGTLHDLQDSPGYHPGHDQVVTIAVRPLVERVFRWQQRLLNAPEVSLRMELECEHIEWFPARLRHLLDGLLSNAVKYRDPEKAEMWVMVSCRADPAVYEVQIWDNGRGMQERDRDQLFELIARAGPLRAAGLGVGLAVIQVLIEESGGVIKAESLAGRGSAFTLTLPRFEAEDFLL